MSGHDPYEHAMVGAYVTDALDDDERARFERHLAGCDSCRHEVVEFTEALGELNWLAATPPPSELRTSVLSEIANVRPLPPAEPHTTDEPPVQAAPRRPDADDLSVRRQRRTRRILTGLVAAALVLALALGGWVVVLVGEQRAQQAAVEQVSELLTAPDAQVHTAELNGSRVSYVVSQQRNRALFIGTDVTAPPSGRVYQLWMLRPGNVAEPNGTINHGGTLTAWLTEPVDNASGLAVTVEPVGGSPRPTTTPLAVVEL